MKVLAIDPGTEMSAWCVVIDGKPFESGKQLNCEVAEKLREWKKDDWLLAVEMIASYGMPVGKEVFDTCVWIGRFCEAWRGGAHRLIYRREVKLLHCDSVRATDATIRAALIDRFGGKEKAIGKKAAPGPLYGFRGDTWSALAVALTADRTPIELEKAA